MKNSILDSNAVVATKRRSKTDIIHDVIQTMVVATLLVVTLFSLAACVTSSSGDLTRASTVKDKSSGGGGY